MSKYMIRDVQEKDIKAIVDIYNSNDQFLFYHLGVKSVDETFMIQEISTMKKLSFRPSVIVNQQNSKIQGILDYKLEQEVYLSLIMLAKNLQGNGTGSSLYSYFESKMIQDKRDSIRIDVVNNYQKVTSSLSVRGIPSAKAYPSTSFVISVPPTALFFSLDRKSVV